MNVWKNVLPRMLIATLGVALFSSLGHSFSKMSTEQLELFDHHKLYRFVFDGPEDKVAHGPESIEAEGEGNSEEEIIIRTSDGAQHVFREVDARQIEDPQVSLSTIVENVLLMKGRTFEHVDGNTKFIVTFFEDIKMVTEDGVTLIGRYAGSSYRDQEKYVQHYLDGDECDLCPGKRRSCLLYFSPGLEEASLNSPKEVSTCKYKAVITGKEISSQRAYKKIEYRVVR